VTRAAAAYTRRPVDILELMRERAGDYDCPVCKRALVGCRLTMLREEDPLYTVQVGCSSCQVTFVVVLQVREQVVERIEQQPDRGERSRARRRARARRRVAVRPPISGDELLDLHELLRDHDGPITELLRPASAARQDG